MADDREGNRRRLRQRRVVAADRLDPQAVIARLGVGRRLALRAQQDERKRGAGRGNEQSRSLPLGEPAIAGDGRDVPLARSGRGWSGCRGLCRGRSRGRCRFGHWRTSLTLRTTSGVVVPVPGLLPMGSKARLNTRRTSPP